MTIKRIGILTAGGDCPGLNAVVRAVAKNALGQGIEVFGVRNGFDGLVRNDIFKITNDTVSGILNIPWPPLARPKIRGMCLPLHCTILKSVNWTH